MRHPVCKQLDKEETNETLPYRRIHFTQFNIGSNNSMAPNRRQVSSLNNADQMEYSIMSYTRLYIIILLHGIYWHVVWSVRSEFSDELSHGEISIILFNRSSSYQIHVWFPSYASFNRKTSGWIFLCLPKYLHLYGWSYPLNRFVFECNFLYSSDSIEANLNKGKRFDLY